MKKMIILGVASVVVLGLIWGAKYGLDYMYYEKTMPTVVIQNLDFSEVSNGVYTGSFNAKIIAATAEVTVDEGKVIGIELIKHKYERGGPAVAIIDDILEKQSLNVDTISGATESSKTILKAVENALTGKATK
jgi:uncharacterized protein with FMN-binding domain